MKCVTSRDNPDFKALRLLATDAREQQRQGRTLLEGPHLVAAYRERIGLPESIVISESGERNAEVRGLLESHAGVPVIQLRDALFGEISGLASPVGVLAVISIPPAATAPLIESCVVLEGIQDAGNVGTILRTAAAAGIRDVVLGNGCAGAWTPRVLRAAQGAHFNLALRHHENLAMLVHGYAGLSVATVAAGGASLYALDLREPVMWIFGNEGAGVSPELQRAAKTGTTIPMAAGSESLNVAAAAAVCLFEQVRQRTTG